MKQNKFIRAKNMGEAIAHAAEELLSGPAIQSGLKAVLDDALKINAGKPAAFLFFDGMRYGASAVLMMLYCNKLDMTFMEIGKKEESEEEDGNRQ